MWAGRNAEAPRRLVPRLALVLLAALTLTPVAQAKTPPPDATFPKKKAATKGAA